LGTSGLLEHVKAKHNDGPNGKEAASKRSSGVPFSACAVEAVEPIGASVKLDDSDGTFLEKAAVLVMVEDNSLGDAVDAPTGIKDRFAPVGVDPIRMIPLIPHSCLIKYCFGEKHTGCANMFGPERRLCVLVVKCEIASGEYVVREKSGQETLSSEKAAHCGWQVTGVVLCGAVGIEQPRRHHMGFRVLVEKCRHTRNGIGSQFGIRVEEQDPLAGDHCEALIYSFRMAHILRVLNDPDRWVSCAEFINRAVDRGVVDNHNLKNGIV
jgi:hypothetical protein